MDEEIRHFLDTGETPNGAKAEVRKTVQLPPDVHVRLGLYASEMSVKTGQRVSLAQAVDMALKVATSAPVAPSRLKLMAKLADAIEAELPAEDDWTVDAVTEEATIYIDGELISMFERNWAAARATRPSNRDTPIPMVEAKIIVVDMQTGEVVHRQGGTYVQ